MSEPDDKEIVAIEWKHNETFGDWSLDIPLPQGSIKGCVSFTHPHGRSGAKPRNTVWGTIEVQVPGHEHQETTLYDSPPEGVDAVSRGIMAVMAGIITELQETD